MGNDDVLTLSITHNNHRRDRVISWLGPIGDACPVILDSSGLDCASSRREWEKSERA